jgi:hypothetical protein
VENEDWNEELQNRNRMTTKAMASRDRREGFMLTKGDRSMAKSHPVQHQYSGARAESQLFASLYQAGNSAR